MASKGTGRARQGSIRSPQFRGGGIVLDLLHVHISTAFLVRFVNLQSSLPFPKGS